MRKPNQEKIDFCRKEYLSGKTIEQIARENGYGAMTVQRYVKDLVRHGFDKRYASNEDKEKICRLYLDGNSTVQIAKLFACNNKTIASILADYNILRTGVGKRKYSLNEHFFDVIDTEEKAYVLGLLYADGSNGKSKSTISISLEECDREILEKVRECLESEKELEYLDYSNKTDFGYHYKNQYRLLLFSAHMCKTLEKHGMVPNKSLVLQFPTCVPDELVRHFVRGYFDGDGTMGWKDLSTFCGDITVSIMSTKMFCVRLQEIISALGIATRIAKSYCNNGVTSTISISKKSDMLTFLEWMYDGSTIYLKRKHEIYEAYKKAKAA